jgi:RNA polymerase sigma factor (sigma-70 family)
MQSEDEILLGKLRKGERKAMVELYDTWAPVLMGVALRYCNRRDDAEDMVHESLLKILKGVNDFKPAFNGAFEAWMKRITVNQCLTALRRKPDFHLDDSILKEEAELLMDEETEDDRLPEISQKKIIEMMQELPPGYRTVLNLYVFEQMSHKEIAKELNISENTSKSQLSKARNLMKRMLQQMIIKEEVTK